MLVKPPRRRGMLLMMPEEVPLLIDEVYRVAPPASFRNLGQNHLISLRVQLKVRKKTTDRPGFILFGYLEHMDELLVTNRGLQKRITVKFNLPRLHCRGLQRTAEIL